MPWELNDILNIIKTESYEIRGDPNSIFSGINAIDEATPNDYTFCSKLGYEGITLINKSNGKIILVDERLIKEDLNFLNKTLIFIKNPRLWYIKSLEKLFPKVKNTGIHSTAIIGKDCIVGKNIYIGPYSIIENGVIIGDNTQIFNNVHILSGVRIGNNVEINSGCVIGSDGFGYEKLSSGEYEKFPQMFSVNI